MPHSDLHKAKSKKNWAVLAILAGFMVLVWAVTIIKMGMYSDMGAKMRAEEAAAAQQEQVAADIEPNSEEALDPAVEAIIMHNEVMDEEQPDDPNPTD